MHHVPAPWPAPRSARDAAPALPLLALYGAAAEQPLAQFERTALRLLAEALGCDGAVWGYGVRDAQGMRITHAVVLDRPEGLLPDYGAVAAGDPLTAAFLGAPAAVHGGEVDRLYADAARAAVHDYLARYDIAHLMLCGAPLPAAATDGALGWFTLYRAGRDAPLQAAQRDALAAAVPFWLQAHEMCARLALARDAGSAGYALADRGGRIHFADDGFRASLGPGGRRGRASPPDRAAQAFDLGDARITARAWGDWQVLQARPREEAPAGERLSAREAEVARRYAAGASYKEIARAQGVAPDTVRTQLQHVYRKLGVHTKIALARALGPGPDGDQAEGGSWKPPAR